MHNLARVSVYKPAILLAIQLQDREDADGPERASSVSRVTKETSIKVELKLDGTGNNVDVRTYFFK